MALTRIISEIIQDNTVDNADISASFSTSISGSLGANADTIRTLSSTTVSGSFTSISSSLAARLTSEEGEAEGSVISSSAQIATDISGSLGVNAGVIRTLSAATVSGSRDAASISGSRDAVSISGSLGANAGVIRTLSAATVSGSFGNQRVGTTDDVKFANITGSGNVSASGNLFITGNVDVDGTSNFAGNVTLQNDLVVTGRIDAEEIHTTFISSSIAQATGSNIFGDSINDSHQFTGSIDVSGSGTVLQVSDGNVDFDGDLDVDGTTNLDVVDIDGATTITGTSAFASSATNLSTSVSKMALRVQGSSDSSTSLWMGALANDAQQYIQACNDAGNGADDIVLNPFGGKVGVGVGNASPQSELHVSGSGEVQVFIDAQGGNNGGIRLLEAGANKWTIGNDQSDDKLFFYEFTNNQTRMVIESDGKVGIGEDSPLATLHVKEGDSGLSSLNGSGTNLFLEANGANAAGMTLASGTGANGFIIFADSDSNFRGAIQYDHSSPDKMHLTTSGSQRVSIDQHGNVGINETTPITKLDVRLDSTSTDLTADYAMFINNQTGASTGRHATMGFGTYNNGGLTNVFGAVAEGSGAQSGFAFLTHNGGALTEKVRISNGGNVGIGTPTPSGSLHIYAGDQQVSKGFFLSNDRNANNCEFIRFQKKRATSTVPSSGDEIGRIEFAQWDGDEFHLAAVIKSQAAGTVSNNAPNGNLIFMTIDGSDPNPAERMRLDNVGNLGIGASSFGPRLHAIVDDNEYAAYFTSDSSSGTSAALGVRADYGSGTRVVQAFFNGGSNIGEITYNGSALTYGGTSDERLKKDISSYTGGLSIINQMGVKNFTWKEHDKKDVGLIAQELYDILPSRVIEGSGEEEVDRPWQVDYPRLVPYLISAVQELSSEITDLKKEVKELKS